LTAIAFPEFLTVKESYISGEVASRNVTALGNVIVLEMLKILGWCQI